MYHGNKITVIIPCYNEQDGIVKVLSDVDDFVDEVLVVDNGSTDLTRLKAKEMKATVISEPLRGYGKAYRAGFQRATGDIIVTLDGDYSYPARAIKRLLDIFLASDHDFLSACRFPLSDADAMSFTHYVGNKFLTAMCSLIFAKRIEDSQSGMWIFYRRILPLMRLSSKGMPFSEEIKIEAMCHPRIKFGEVHIEYSSRVGEIKLRPIADGMKNFLFLFKKRAERFLIPYE